MFSAFSFSFRLYFRLCLQSLSRSGKLGQLSLRGRLLRLLLYLVVLPLFLLHWLGLFLDEIFFRGYRRVAIQAPVFILGVPRSGTTFLHRTLAADDRLFTTVATWEVFIAPSVSQRLFFRGLGRLDRAIGSPFTKLLNRLEKKLFRGLEGIHDVSLQAAEEDYLLLLPILSCFILFLPFTESSYIWNLSRLDWAMEAEDRRRILRFYRACLQKHLYFHGEDKIYLSKNAAFASWVISLQQEFPDARFVICMRDPAKAVPSLLGSLESGARFFELDLDHSSLSERLVIMMQDSYRHLLTNRSPEWEIVTMDALKTSVADCVQGIYQHFELPLSRDYQQALNKLVDEASHFATRTTYIDPAAGQADNFFTDRFPWYYATMEAETPRSPDGSEAES